MRWGLREGQVSISQAERLNIIKSNKQGLSLRGKKPSSTILSWKAGVLYQIVRLDLFRHRISSPVKTIHFLHRKQCGLLCEHDEWVVMKQSNGCIFITEKSNSENLKPDTSDNFKAHLTDNTGMLFHWDFLTALKSCPHRAQPPLPECTPAQFQTWRIFPVLSQLPQQPDPRPGRNSICPAPVPQQSGQRCHPELQPGTCPKQSWSLTPEILWSSSQERAVRCLPTPEFLPLVSISFNTPAAGWSYHLDFCKSLVGWLA